MKSERV